RPPSGSCDPVFELVASDSPLDLSKPRPDVSLSGAFLPALASSGLLLSSRLWLAPTRCGDRLVESGWRLRRSQLPLVASVGRCCPPGLSAVQAGQWSRPPAPSPVPFCPQRVS